MRKTKLSLEDIEGIIPIDRLEEANELLYKIEQGYIPEYGYERELFMKVLPIRREQLEQLISWSKKLGLQKACEMFEQRLMRLEVTKQIIEEEERRWFHYEQRSQSR